MANMFLYLTNIQGESQDHSHRGEIEIHDFDWGMDNAASFRLKEDDAAKQTQTEHLTVHKKFDRASPTLMNYCANGRHIDEAVLTCRKNAGDDQVAYLKIFLTGVKVNSVKWTPRGEDHGGIPETIDLSFFWFKIVYETQIQDGSLAGKTEFEWDVAKEKPQAAAAGGGAAKGG
jgi:type VI secretion system secreted protein Hcp